MSLSRDTVSPSSDRSSIRSSANSLNSPSPEITACFQSSRQLASSLARRDPTMDMRKKFASTGKSAVTKCYGSRLDTKEFSNVQV